MRHWIPRATLERPFSVQQAGLLLHYQRSGLINAGRSRPHSWIAQQLSSAMPDDGRVTALHVQGGEDTARISIRLRYTSRLNRPGEVRALHIAQCEQRVLKRNTGRRSFRSRGPYRSRASGQCAGTARRIPNQSGQCANQEASSPAPCTFMAMAATYGASNGTSWFSHADPSLTDRAGCLPSPNVTRRRRSW